MCEIHPDKEPHKCYLLHESSLVPPETEAMGAVLPGLSARPGYRCKPVEGALLPGSRTHGNRQL